jgi:hypothetical protein
LVAGLNAQTPNLYRITPESVTILVGDSRPFRMVDRNGRGQHEVAWEVSDSYALEISAGDEALLTARRAGDFRLTARTDHGTAEATIKVVEGAALPVGTVKWSAGKMAGCRTAKIVPAVPSANGPDIFEQSECEDGSYISAYTSEGVQMWRRRMGGAEPTKLEEGNPAPTVNRLDSRTSSVCDSITVGMEQAKAREALGVRHLSFRDGAPGERLWTMEESNTQCKVWFDEKLMVVKKRKTLLAN